jgi:hypothetical protein
MFSYPGLMLQFVAATGILAVLSTAAPAVAAESTVTAAATPKTATSVVKRDASIHRHASRGTRIVASYHDRDDSRVSPIRSNLDCSGVWCGRQFVLMIGIGY